MKINELTTEAHHNAIMKGFYDFPETGGHLRNIGEILMLIVSELGEAMEAHRCGKFTEDNLDIFIKESNNPNVTDCSGIFEFYVKDTFEDELADTVIRIADLCGYLGIDLEKHIAAKMEYNKTRPYKHGKEY